VRQTFFGQAWARTQAGRAHSPWDVVCKRGAQLATNHILTRVEGGFLEQSKDLGETKERVEERKKGTVIHR